MSIIKPNHEILEQELATWAEWLLVRVGDSSANKYWIKQALEGYGKAVKEQTVRDILRQATENLNEANSEMEQLGVVGWLNKKD